MGLQVEDNDMAQEAHRLLHKVFHTKKVTLARLIEGWKLGKELDRHIRGIAAGEFSPDIVTGVHTIIVLAAESAAISTDASNDFRLGQVFTVAESFLDGSHRYMLSWLKQAKREMPAWLERR